jgi:hypothetical protein
MYLPRAGYFWARHFRTDSCVNGVGGNSVESCMDTLGFLRGKLT